MSPLKYGGDAGNRTPVRKYSTTDSTRLVGFPKPTNGSFNVDQDNRGDRFLYHPPPANLSQEN